MPEPFLTVEKAVEFVDAYQGEPEGLLLPVSDELQDPMGMNMAIIGESILAKGFIPDGFEQRDGFRIYKYKSMDEIDPNGRDRAR